MEGEESTKNHQNLNKFFFPLPTFTSGKSGLTSEPSL